jgi:hypothetical protein
MKWNKTMMDIGRNCDGMERTNGNCDRQQWQQTTMATNDDSDEQRWRYKAIDIYKLCNDGVQKRGENFFSSTSCFFF